MDSEELRSVAATNGHGCVEQKAMKACQLHGGDVFVHGFDRDENLETHPEAKKDADPAARQTAIHDSSLQLCLTILLPSTFTGVSLTKKKGKLLEDLVFAAHEDLVFPSKSHKVSYPCVARTATHSYGAMGLNMVLQLLLMPLNSV
ncbi:unnamed protein product [Rhodiola kirilowii]